MTQQEELAQLHREIDAEFREKYSGVIGVGYGLRERAGQITREIAFRVYVRKRRSHLNNGDIIPALSEHGSQELRQAAARYRDEVLARASAFDNLHELVDRLNERQPA